MRPSRRQTPLFTRPMAGRPTATAVLVGFGVGAYVAQLTIIFMLGNQGEALPQGADTWLRGCLALDRASFLGGDYWKLFTFPFLHEINPLHLNPLHLLINMVLLYFAGREVEPIVGAKSFLGIYGIGLLAGGLAHLAAPPTVALVGASAGVVAILVAFCTILPELAVEETLFSVVRVRLRARHLAVALVVVNVVLWYTDTLPQIGPVAMLAGCVAGWLFVKQLGFGNPLAIQRYLFEKRERAARLERMSPEQFMSREIDPILEKISREGLHRLTRAERKILAQGSDKVAARPARK